MYPSPKPNPNDKAYNVYRTKYGITSSPGVVMAPNHILADTKAKRLFGYDCWTRLKEVEEV
jgi:hypothetical protein